MLKGILREAATCFKDSIRFVLFPEPAFPLQQIERESILTYTFKCGFRPFFNL
jgi:hypothetical protein